MNKKAGFLISFLIFIVLFIAGFYIGYKFNSSRSGSEAENLQNSLSRKDSEILSLQSQVAQISAKEKEECLERLNYEYKNKSLSRQLSVIFKNNLTTEEAGILADKYSLDLVRLINSGSAVFEVPENLDIFEQSCVLEKDDSILTSFPAIQE